LGGALCVELRSGDGGVAKIDGREGMTALRLGLTQLRDAVQVPAGRREVGSRARWAKERGERKT